LLYIGTVPIRKEGSKVDVRKRQYFFQQESLKNVLIENRLRYSNEIGAFADNEIAN